MTKSNFNKTSYDVISVTSSQLCHRNNATKLSNLPSPSQKEISGYAMYTDVTKTKHEMIFITHVTCEILIQATARGEHMLPSSKDFVPPLKFLC